MSRNRVALLAASSVVVALLLGSGFAVRVGAADGAYRQAVAFSEVLSLVLDNYVDEVQSDDLLAGAYEGLLGSLGEDGAYLSPDEVRAWKRGETGAAESGLSVLKAYGALQIVSVERGSPADEAGLAPGDQIRRIDGRSLRRLSIEQARRLLRGEPGTSVELTVLLPREGFRRKVVSVVRRMPSGTGFGLDVEEGVAVLRVDNLGRAEPEAVARELEQVWSRGIRHLLVDLRGNASANVRDASGLLGLFATGPLLRLQNRQGEVVETVSSGGPGTSWHGPIGVLVDGGTAAGAEAVARVLAERRGAIVLGEGTYGAGSEPELFELDGGGGLLIPSYRWLTASAASWEQTGIVPDTAVKAEGGGEAGQAAQLKRAVEILTERPAETTPERRAA